MRNLRTDDEGYRLVYYRQNLTAGECTAAGRGCRFCESLLGPISQDPQIGKALLAHVGTRLGLVWVFACKNAERLRK